MKRKKIMIIDDHPLLRDAWSLILESTQTYEVTDKIGKGAGLVDQIRNKKPDLILLDISIAQVYEFPIIKLIRKFSPLTKIIAISVQLETTYARKLFRAGANGFLNMECQAAELLEAAEAVLKGRNYLCKALKNEKDRKTPTGNSEASDRLTKREVEIIQFVRQGLSSKEIGQKIFVTPKTVDTHRRNILKKLNLKNSTALVQFAHTRGF